MMHNHLHAEDQKFLKAMGIDPKRNANRWRAGDCFTLVKGLFLTVCLVALILAAGYGLLELFFYMVERVAHSIKHA